MHPERYWILDMSRIPLQSGFFKTRCRLISTKYRDPLSGLYLSADRTGQCLKAELVEIERVTCCDGEGRPKTQAQPSDFET